MSASVEPRALTHNQQALWRYQLMHPDAATYGMLGVARIHGELPLAVLRRAWKQLLDKHGVLRCRLQADGDVAYAVEYDLQGMDGHALLPVVDAGAWSEAQFMACVDEHAARAHRFDTDMLFRGVLLQAPALAPSWLAGRHQGERLEPQSASIGPQRLLLMTAHHLVIDFLSFSLLLQELEQLCTRPLTPAEPGPAMVAQANFWAYAAWEQSWLASSEGIRLLAEGAAALRPAPEALLFETAQGEHERVSAATAEQRLRIPDGARQTLLACASQQGVTPFVAMLSVLQVLLHRQSGHQDVTIVTPVHGRANRQFRRTIGYFANVVPLRQSVGPSDCFADLLRRNHDAMRVALRSAALPFPVVKQAAGAHERAPGQDPYAQVALVWDVLRDIKAQTDSQTASFEALHVEQTGTPYDLSLTVYAGEDAWTCGLRHNPQVLSSARVMRIARLLPRYAEKLCRSAFSRLATLALIDPPSWHCGSPLLAHPAADPIDACLQSLARQQCEAPALRERGRGLNFQELERLTFALAGCLLRIARPTERLVILMERGLDLVLLLIAAYRAGLVAVPLNPGQTQAWLSQAVELARSRHLICSSSLAHRAQALAPVCTMFDDLLADRHETTTAADLSPVHPRQPAYIIFTSGSTGIPKGVAVERASLHHLLASNAFLFGESRQRWTLMHHPSFDFAMWEIWGPLSHGHALTVLSEEEYAQPAAVHDAVQRNGITHMGMTPAAAQLLLPLLRKGGIASLRCLCLGGSSVPATLVERLRALELEVRIFYGPTEATVWATCTAPTDTAQAAFIGLPLPGMRAYVLGPQLEWVDEMQGGELYLAGPQLASYFAAPRLSAQAFVPDPWHAGERMYRTGDRVRYTERNGLEFLGRMDRQVKINGYRAELDDIESRIAANAQIAQVCCVQSIEDDGLIALYTTPDDQALAPADLNAWARECLPRHLLPVRFTHARAVPLTHNGKPDLAVLQALAARPHSDAQPQQSGDERSRIVAQIVSVFKQNLDLADVPLDRNFHELGASSLMLMRARSQLMAALGKPLELVDLYTFSTISKLADWILSGALEDAPPPDRERRPRAQRLARRTDQRSGA